MCTSKHAHTHESRADAVKINLTLKTKQIITIKESVIIITLAKENFVVLYGLGDGIAVHWTLYTSAGLLQHRHNNGGVMSDLNSSKLRGDRSVRNHCNERRR